MGKRYRKMSKKANGKIWSFWAFKKDPFNHKPLESCFSVTRTVTERVKKWNGGDMVQRWAVAVLLRAERKFKRVKGYREIPKLIAALQQKNLDRKEVAV